MRLDTTNVLTVCFHLFLVFSISTNLANAIPSGTHLQFPEQDSVSRAHSANPSPFRFASFSYLRDTVIDVIWQYFNPTDFTAPPRCSKSNVPSRHLHAQYADQLVLRFNVTTPAEAAGLAEAADLLFLDVWTSSADWVDIRIAQNVVPSLLGLLPKSLQHAHTPLMTNQELLRAVADTYLQTSRTLVDTSTKLNNHYTSISSSKHVPETEPPTDVFFDEYRSLTVITHWMRFLQSLFTTHVRVITVGTTHDNHPIVALRLGKQQHTLQPSEPRKTILITAGSHAREWISTSTVTYIAYALITNYGRDKTATRLLDEFDWILVPTLNPDGYQYTWEADRLWRKTRQPTPLRFCRGLDLDRTWPFHWDGAATTLDNPCSESYAGSEALEAQESRSFAAWAREEVNSGNTTFVALLDLHSYAEQILYPYSYSCGASPPHLEDLAELGQGLAKAIRASTKGHESYRVMSACEGNVNSMFHLHPKTSSASETETTTARGGGGGSMLDWFYHELNVKKAFQIKLRDKGSYGFLLPKEFIVPTGVEILRAVEYLGMSLSETGPWAVDVDDDDGDDRSHDDVIKNGEAQRPLS